MSRNRFICKRTAKLVGNVTFGLLMVRWPAIAMWRLPGHWLSPQSLHALLFALRLLIGLCPNIGLWPALSQFLVYCSKALSLFSPSAQDCYFVLGFHFRLCRTFRSLVYCPFFGLFFRCRVHFKIRNSCGSIEHHSFDEMPESLR